MSALSVTLQGQAAAESIMLDACLIERPDPDDFNGPPLTIYEGKCRVKMFGRAANEQPEMGGLSSDLHRCRVDIPVSATGVQYRDKVTITASVNPGLAAGFDALVSDITTGTFLTAQRLLCERSLR